MGIVPYKSGFIDLFVFLCRGRVPRPAGGETPPLQGSIEFVICTVKFHFVKISVGTTLALSVKRIKSRGTPRTAFPTVSCDDTYNSLNRRLTNPQALCASSFGKGGGFCEAKDGGLIC